MRKVAAFRARQLCLHLLRLAARADAGAPGVHQDEVRVLLGPGSFLSGSCRITTCELGNLGVHREQRVHVIAEDVQLPGDVRALLAGLAHRHRTGVERLVRPRALRPRTDSPSPGCTSPVNSMRSEFGASGRGRREAARMALKVPVPIVPVMRSMTTSLGEKLAVHPDVLGDALPDHVEQPAAEMGLSLAHRLGDGPGDAHFTLQRAPRAPQVRKEAGEEGEIELARPQVAREASVQDGRRAARQERASAEIRITFRLARKLPPPGGSRLKVHQCAARARLHGDVRGAQPLLLRGDVADRDLARELADGPAYRRGRRGPSAGPAARPAWTGQLRGAGNRQPRHFQVQGDRTVEQRRDRVALVPAQRQLHQLRSGERCPAWKLATTSPCDCAPRIARTLSAMVSSLGMQDCAGDPPSRSPPPC